MRGILPGTIDIGPLIRGLFVLICVTLLVSQASGAVRLTVDDARALAVQSNRGFLSSHEDVKKAEAEVTRAWSEALPDVSLDASYNRSFRVPSVFFSTVDEAGQTNTLELQLGFKNSYQTTVSVSQPIWSGGKVFTALKIARLYKEYSAAGSQAARANVVYTAERLFYTNALARAQLEVQQRALDAADRNLDVVEQKYSQGVVSEFEVLRARVEHQNILPLIIQAEGKVELSEKRLKSFLGIDLNADIEIIDVQEADTSLAGLPALPSLTGTALDRRPEMVQADRLTGITEKAIKVAGAERWPEINAVGAFDWSAASDDFTLRENNSKSWTAGVTLHFPIFTGGRVRGDVAEAKADHRQAVLAHDQMRDDVSLEVEEAYINLLQSKKSLDAQSATIASAEEGLKIANVRYDSGVGTQLEVLSAQTALTQARETRATALYVFRVARAQLKKATTVDL
jgi:outer membrane protein TolC